MECYNCGMEIPADATACPRCGIRFAPRTAAEAPSSDRRTRAETQGRSLWIWGVVLIGVLILAFLLWNLGR